MNIRPFQGTTPSLGQNVYIDPAAVVIGDVVIGDESSVWPFTAVRGDVNHIRIGQRTSVQDGSVLHVTHDGPYNPGGYPLLIGDEVTIGHRAMLHGCTIGSRILIGMSAIVLDGAVIENEVILGAGSLVPPRKTLESGWVYMGRPAKAVRRLTDKELDYFSYTAGRYVQMTRDYLAETP